MFTIYSVDVTGNSSSCSYLHKHVILDEDSLKIVICHDYVCTEYKNGYHNDDNFIGSGCLPVDCDNDHSENPNDRVTPDDIMQVFPGVSFAIHYSRYSNREENGKATRPKPCVLLPTEYISNASLYSDTKRLVNSIFPYFDTQVPDAARFFSGTTTADVSIYPGRMNLIGFLNGNLFDEDLPGGQYDGFAILGGGRNATMPRFVDRVIKECGGCDETYQTFMEEPTKYTLPLGASELTTIWHNAQRFCARFSQQDGYISPEIYNGPSCYEPGGYSDARQAEVLAKYFSGEFRYSPAAHFI